MALSTVVLVLVISFLQLSYGLYFHIGETERKCFIEEIPDETMVVGNYKVEMYDKNVNAFVPTVYGLGMHVECRDPDDRIILSRVRREARSLINPEIFPSVLPACCNYKVQAYDHNTKDYMPVSPDIGMHVEVNDPESKIILSRTYAAEGRFTFTSHTAGEHVICLNSNSSAWFNAGQLRVHLDINVGEHAVDYQQVQAKDKLTELQLRVRQLLDQVEQITKEQNYQREREERFRFTSESTNQRVFIWAIVQTAVVIALGVWQYLHLRSFFIKKKIV